MEPLFENCEFAKPEFWDQQFGQSKSQFDWYLDFEQLRVYFEKVIPVPKSARVLLVGVGNSQLSEKMHDAGFQNTVSIDLSSVVIEKMQQVAL